MTCEKFAHNPGIRTTPKFVQVPPLRHPALDAGSASQHSYNMEKNTESTRQLKVAKEIQKHMAEIIRCKGMAAFGGALVSVSGVKISPDLSFAKVYVSIFPSDKAEAVMNVLEENTRPLRGELGAKVAKQLRITPEIVFCLDSSLDYVEHIEELLKK